MTTPLPARPLTALLCLALLLASSAAGAEPPGHRYVLAPSFASNVVTVFDLDTGALAASIPVQARGPCCANAMPDGSKVFVVDGMSPEVTIIDVSSLRVLGKTRLRGTIGDRGQPIQDDGKLFWVSELPQGHIEALDTATGRIVHSFGFISNTFTVSHDGASLYSGNVTALRTLFGVTATTFATRSPVTGKVLGTTLLPLAADNTPLQMYATLDDRKVYVQMLGPKGVVHVVDVSDRVHPRYLKTVQVGAVPIVANFSPDGSQLWFPNSGDGTVSILDTTTDEIVHVIDIGPYVAGVKVLGDRAYVSLSPGIPAIPLLSEALLFAGLIPGAVLTPPTGSTDYRPLLELPGEIQVYDAHTYQRIDFPTMTLPSVSQIIEVLQTAD